MDLADNFKGIPNTGTVTSFKSNSTDDASFPINLVVLEFIIGQGIVLVVIEFGPLF